MTPEAADAVGGRWWGHGGAAYVTVNDASDHVAQPDESAVSYTESHRSNPVGAAIKSIICRRSSFSETGVNSWRGGNMTHGAGYTSLLALRQMWDDEKMNVTRLVACLSVLGIVAGALTVLARIDTVAPLPGFLQPLTNIWLSALVVVWAWPMQYFSFKPDPVTTPFLTLAVVLPYLAFGARVGLPSWWFLTEEMDQIARTIKSYVEACSRIPKEKKEELAGVLSALTGIIGWSVPIFLLFFIMLGPQLLIKLFTEPTTELFLVLGIYMTPLMFGALLSRLIAQPLAIGIRIWLIFSLAVALYLVSLISSFFGF